MHLASGVFSTLFAADVYIYVVMDRYIYQTLYFLFFPADHNIFRPPAGRSAHEVDFLVWFVFPSPIYIFKKQKNGIEMAAMISIYTPRQKNIKWFESGLRNNAIVYIAPGKKQNGAQKSGLRIIAQRRVTHMPRTHRTMVREVDDGQLWEL